MYYNQVDNGLTRSPLVVRPTGARSRPPGPLLIPPTMWLGGRCVVMAFGWAVVASIALTPSPRAAAAWGRSPTRSCSILSVRGRSRRSRRLPAAPTRRAGSGARSGRCGTSAPSGLGPRTRWPRPVTPSGPFPRSSTGSAAPTGRIPTPTTRIPTGRDPRQPPRARAQPSRLGPVLLTGYSQGSILALAAAAQLPRRRPARRRAPDLACPARRLYGRAFPSSSGRSTCASSKEPLTGTTGAA